MANAFFGQPDKKVEGWESANAAQARIVQAVDAHVSNHQSETILFVGHGAVGTLLKCHIGQFAISRAQDQGNKGAKGGGNIFAFDWTARQLISDWVALENWPAAAV